MQHHLTVAGPAGGRAIPLRIGRLGDERLARLVAGGSERALEALYERYHQALYRYCRAIVRHDEDAQDALQSTMTNALVALRRGQRDAPLRPWLFRIAHNESVTLLRRRRPAEELGEALGDAGRSIVERVAERERLALLVADLQELPERQRGALLMRELSGLSHEEIAIALGVSVGAAKQTIFAARRGLAEFAEGRAMACDDARRAISDGDGRVLRSRRVRAHVRDCASCAAFAAAIPERRAELSALAPPLAPVAAASVLARVLGGASPHGAGSAGVAATAGGKSAAALLASKVVAGAAVLAAATAGVSGVLRHGSHAVHRTATPTTARPVPLTARPAAPPLATPHRRHHRVHHHPPAAASPTPAIAPPSTPAIPVPPAPTPQHALGRQRTPQARAHARQPHRAKAAPHRTAAHVKHQRPVFSRGVGHAPAHGNRPGGTAPGQRPGNGPPSAPPGRTRLTAPGLTAPPIKKTSAELDTSK